MKVTAYRVFAMGCSNNNEWEENLLMTFCQKQAYEFYLQAKETFCRDNKKFVEISRKQEREEKFGDNFVRFSNEECSYCIKMEKIKIDNFGLHFYTIKDLNNIDDDYEPKLIATDIGSYTEISNAITDWQELSEQEKKNKSYLDCIYNHLEEKKIEWTDIIPNEIYID